MTTKPNNEWEKEFDERFASIDGEDFVGWIVDKNGKRVSDWNIDHYDLGVVKSFINQLLSSERQKLRKLIMNSELDTEAHSRGRCSFPLMSICSAEECRIKMELLKLLE